MQRQDISKAILLISLILVFGWFGLDKFLSPLVWISWIPQWMEGLIGLTRGTWLNIIGAAEIIMAILLVMPVRNIRRAATVLITLHFIGILTQTGWNDIAVRDIGLMMSAIALLFLL